MATGGKAVRFEVSRITPGNTRVMTVPDKDGTIALLDDSNNLTGIAALTASGLLTLSAGQIKFPAAQNASADANTLDDYEEGTFAPGITFGNAAVGITYATQEGKYTKVGNVVSATLRVVLTNKGSSTGSAKITGLPFAPTVFAAVAFGYTYLVTFTGTILGYLDTGVANINLAHFDEGGGTAVLTNADFSNGSYIMATVIYQV